MRTYLILIVLLLLVVPRQVEAQEQNESDALVYKPRIVAIPILFYGPETRLGFGGAGFFSFKTNPNDTILRPSQINVGAAYTLEKQVLTYASYDLWLLENKLVFNGEFGYYRYFYNFYGIGNTPRNVEQYSVNYPRIRFKGYYELFSSFYAGIHYTFDDFDIVKRAEGGQLIQNTITGSQGGIISGLGLGIKYDTRNHNFYPTTGYSIRASYERFGNWVGSDFTYDLTTIDVIRYFDLKKDRVIAANVYGRFIYGDAPFYHLSSIGGNSQMRGYYDGYWMDKQKIGWQAEYRTPVYGRLGMVAFAGNAIVADQLDHMQWKYIRTTAGLGLRIKIDEERKINARLDFGVSSDLTTGFYFTIGEAF
ncbi:BamA/TamA family outer membrane protein [Brumimicrobium aurantiacum]|uniref:BamA/TamA family outer membrane protein n=1 Tax=Brumimicrobium aurantiacum TaxID=1737063 RepID=UPI0014026507|nr:BamA/TamA family outer membrane protein [Brumimicrobium aurantiacum]